MRFMLHLCLIFWWVMTVYGAIKFQTNYAKDNDLIEDDPVVIEDGERIGQFVLNKVAAINWVNKSRVSEFSDLTDRGGGYGHSGTK